MFDIWWTLSPSADIQYKIGPQKCDIHFPKSQAPGTNHVPLNVNPSIWPTLWKTIFKLFLYFSSKRWSKIGSHIFVTDICKLIEYFCRMWCFASLICILMHGRYLLSLSQEKGCLSRIGTHSLITADQLQGWTVNEKLISVAFHHKLLPFFNCKLRRGVKALRKFSTYTNNQRLWDFCKTLRKLGS